MRISVVIPLFNKNKTILDTLNSVFRQTFAPFEIIVVNDGSTDESEKLVNSLNNPLIRLFNQANKGVSSARNKGVDESKGDWIAFLDADDIWLPDFLMTITNLHNRFKDCKVLATSYFIQNTKGRNKIILNDIRFDEEEGVLTNYYSVSSISHPPVWSSAVVIQKAALKNIGGFPTGIISGEDLLTWAKLAAEHKIAYSKRLLSVFVQDRNQGSPTRIPQEPDVVGKELIALKKRYPDLHGINKYIAHWFKMRASIYFRSGNRKKACGEIFRSLSYNPFNSRLIIYLIMLPLPLNVVKKIFVRFGN